MCIIVYKPTTAKMPNKKTLRKCWENNKDGAGYMFPSKGSVIIKKGFMNWVDFYNNLRTDQKRYGEFTPFVLHFRIQTQGGVNPECTHPFPLSTEMSDLRKLRVKTNIGVAHNGIIDLTTTGWKTTVNYSDTMKFITDYLTLIIKDKNYYKDKDKLTLIERLIESKMAIMDGNGHTELIGDFIEDGGCYFSNQYYKESRYKKYTYTTPTTTTTTTTTTTKVKEEKPLTEQEKQDIIDYYEDWNVKTKSGKYWFDELFCCPKEDFGTSHFCKQCLNYESCLKRRED